MSLSSPHHDKCPMRSGGDWCNCFTLREHDRDLDRMELDRIKYEAIEKDTARRCAEIAFRLAAGPTVMAHRNGCHDVGVAISREFGLKWPKPSPESTENK